MATAASEAYPGPATQPPDDSYARAVAEAAVQAAAGEGPPVLDGPLSAAAASLAALVQDGRSPPLAAVEFVQSRHGLLAPIPVVVSVEDSAQRPPAELAARLKPLLTEGLRRTGANRLGVGTAPRPGGQVALVALLQPRLASLDSLLPRALPEGGAAPLVGRVAAPLREPSVHLTDPDGAGEQLPAEVTGARFEARIACRGVGRHQVEVLAEGDAGPVVVMNVPVWCGVPAPEDFDPAQAPPGEQDPRRAERRLHALADAERAKVGLAPLVWDDRLAEAARRHSADMAAHGFVAHKSPRSGTPGERVRAVGLHAEGVMENLGLGPDAEAVHAGLLSSPAHRAALLSPQMAQIGIGVVAAPDALGQIQLYATEVLIQPLAALDLAAGRARLAKAARARGLAPHPQLDAVAEAAAARAAAEQLEADAVNAYVVERLKAGPRPPLRALKTLVGVGRKPESLAEGRGGDLSGVGVAVGRDADGLPVYVSVLLVGDSPR